MKKIEFFSTVDGLADACPIIKASEYRPAWMSLAREEYIKMKKQRNDRFSHVYQCPGIFDLYNHGFIVTLWHDVIIKTNGDDKGFAWIIPASDLTELNEKKTLITTHDNSIGKFIPVRPGSIPQVVKFNTPWHVVAPKGVKFLMMPIAYPDSFEFESTVGILDPGISSELNIQVNWNIKYGERTLKAGTPLAHLIPLSEESFDMECRTATELDLRWLKRRNFLNNFTFKPKRNMIKDFYYKHFSKD